MRQKRAIINKSSPSTTRLINMLLWLNGSRKMYDSERLSNWFIDSMAPVNSMPYRLPRFVSKGWEPSVIAGVTCYVKSGSSQHTIFYLHGGGYTQRPTIFHFRYIDQIHELTNANIIFPLYPLAPNASFEEAYEKITTIYKQTRLLSPTHCFTLMGDSAGGGFALGLFMHFKELGIPVPDRLVLVAPWLDITMVNPDIKAIEARDRMLGSIGLIEFGKRWARGADRNQYRLSPIYGDLSLVDELLIVSGTNDILYADADLLKRKLEALNKSVQFIKGIDLPHDYPLMPTRESRYAIETIAKYIMEKPCVIGNQDKNESL